MGHPGQRTRTVYEACVRALYAVVALLLAPIVVLLVFTGLDHLPSHTGNDFLVTLLLPVLAALLILLPSARAWWRVGRGGDLMPEFQLRRRPIVTFIVFAACLLAVAVPIFVPGALYVASLSAIALPVGEGVLIGRDT